MNTAKYIIIFIVLITLSFSIRAQTIDTLIDIGDHHLHFKIIKGKGIPMLFETGAGDDLSVWDNMIPSIQKITGATLILYDRAGFGASTINQQDTLADHHSINNNLEDLEKSLALLEYNQDIMLVSHSYGGYISTLYANKYSQRIKGIVFIDVNHDFYFRNDYLEKEAQNNKKEIKKLKERSPGFYYLALNIQKTVNTVGDQTIPTDIPVIDMVNDIGLFKEKEKNQHWKDCHQKFVSHHPLAKGITAINCHHYIWLDNPELVITAISTLYAQLNGDNEKCIILERLSDYQLNVINRIKTKNK